jgi:hypothetical protein
MLSHLSCRKNESNFALHHCLPLFPAGAAWQGGGAATPPPAACSFPLHVADTLDRVGFP